MFNTVWIALSSVMCFVLFQTLCFVQMGPTATPGTLSAICLFVWCDDQWEECREIVINEFMLSSSTQRWKNEWNVLFDSSHYFVVGQYMWYWDTFSWGKIVTDSSPVLITKANHVRLELKLPSPLVPPPRRNRALQSGNSPYEVDPASVVMGETGCQMDIVNKRNGVVLKADITSLQGNMFRVRVNEKTPMRPRYEVEGVLVSEPNTERWVVLCVCVCWERHWSCGCIVDILLTQL